MEYMDYCIILNYTLDMNQLKPTKASKSQLSNYLQK